LQLGKLHNITFIRLMD